MYLLNQILQLRGYPLGKAQQDLRRIQALETPEFNHWQTTKRWEAARFHFEHNRLYRALFPDGFPGNWENLPIIQKYHLQVPLHQALSTPFKSEQVHVGSTSGSGGHPFYYAKDKYTHAMTYALIADRYAWHGLSLRQRQARFYGMPLSGKSRWLEQAKDLIANRVRFPVFDLSDRQLEVFLKKFTTTPFQYLYGYTSALVLFARFLTKKGRLLQQICPSLTACIVTSEVCTIEDKHLMENAFGIPVINEYGASELDVIAFTDRTGNWVLSKENLFVEVLDQNNQPVPDGQDGKIVITSLHNRAFPMVRYDIGDLGSISSGDTSRLLRLSGRTNDIIQLPSGKKAAGLTFYYVSRSILESGGGLKEFIIKQTELDHFVLEVVSDQPLSPATESKIRNALKAYLEAGLSLTIHRVETIERPAGGKLKHFYSLLP